MSNEKAKITKVLSVVRTQFGAGAIMPLGGAEASEVPVVPTGSLGLDLALGIGGLPRGRVVEVFGPESSGKTTLALHAIAEAQKLGGVCAFIDAEHALDVGYARRLGVSLDDLLVSQPDCGEQALEIADTLVRTGAVDVIVVDSVAALTPRAEIEGEMDNAHTGLQARLMSRAMRKLTAVVSCHNSVVVFINQLRQRSGGLSGNLETTAGGNALRFYASVRLEVRAIGVLKQGGVVIGSRTRVKVVKNKMAPPFKQAEFDILYGVGINKPGEIVDLATESGLMEKNGNWFAWKGERFAQGRDKAAAYIAEHPEVAREIRLALSAAPSEG